MNHVTRAKGILGRSMPNPDRYLLGWYPNFVEELARGLRQVERDARLLALNQAANAAAEANCSTDVPPLQRACFRAVMQLHGPARTRRRRRG